MDMPGKIWADVTPALGGQWSRRKYDKIESVEYIRADKVQKLVEALREIEQSLNGQYWEQVGPKRRATQALADFNGNAAQKGGDA